MPKFEIGELVLSPISEYCGIDTVTGITINNDNQVIYTINNGNCERTEFEEYLKPYARKVKYPAIYLHFKEKYYATMGISKPAKREFLKEIIDKDCELIVTKYTESPNTNIYIYKYKDRYYHNDSKKEDLVLYKSLYDESSAYSRGYGMFLSKVDKLKYPEVKQEYHFELVK